MNEEHFNQLILKQKSFLHHELESSAQKEMSPWHNIRWTWQPFTSFEEFLKKTLHPSYIFFLLKYLSRYHMKIILKYKLLTSSCDWYHLHEEQGSTEESTCPGPFQTCYLTHNYNSNFVADCPLGLRSHEGKFSSST